MNASPLHIQPVTPMTDPMSRELLRRRQVWGAAIKKAQAAFAELRFAERAYIEAMARATTNLERSRSSLKTVVTV